ncbi:alpha/beta fold hydrolase [Longispora albida]|uniref:alpha/beta fold hydrolase n=1 Tax=Longispora albida TaxID=203523 RepID=UPI000368CE6F|nr:alpha/beta fold hydrolase [Longispora albida]
MQFVLPAPTGPHPVGVTDEYLVDSSRPDPWLPETPRELMISVWYPAAGVTGLPQAPWMTGAAAGPFDELVAASGFPAGAVDWASPTAGHAGAPRLPGDEALPVILFSPGLGMARGTATALVSELASHGYTVVTVDHPGEGSPVAFPGGRLRTDNALTDELAGDPARMAGYIGKALDARTADLFFVLDHLGVRTAGVFGHSLGGTTACEAMAQDTRLIAGANLDGPLGESATSPMPAANVARHGHDRPFLLLGAALSRPDGAGGHRSRSHAPDGDPGWADFWARHRGWKRDVTLAGASHHGFTDFPAIYRAAAEAPGMPAQLYERVTGTIDASRAVAVQRACLLAFFGEFLTAGQAWPFDGPGTGWPDLVRVP